jgi:putative cardiolipin synthase
MRRPIKLWLVAVAATLLLGGCVSLPSNIERSESHALQDTGSTRLGQASRGILQSHPGDSSSFRLLERGVDAMLARIVLAETAERSLDVQY